MEVKVKIMSIGTTVSSLVLKVLLDQSERTQDTTEQSSLCKPKFCPINFETAQERKDKRNNPFSYYNNLSSCIPGGLHTAKPSLVKGYCAILKYPSLLHDVMRQM